jgi:hypothetical protein
MLPLVTKLGLADLVKPSFTFRHYAELDSEPNSAVLTLLSGAWQTSITNAKLGNEINSILSALLG